MDDLLSQFGEVLGIIVFRNILTFIASVSDTFDKFKSKLSTEANY